MSLLATTIGEWLGMRGKLWLLPMILPGLGAALYWRFSGDLRLYVAVQFGPCSLRPWAFTCSPE
jgi:hypothetical protein